MKVDRADEGRIRVGTRGWVRYPITNCCIPITVLEIRLAHLDNDEWQLKAKCDVGGGDWRWLFLDEIHTESDHDGC